ncbi:MAG: AAA ATPase [uncultured bacterium]|nr:MAG: AAA ATPase [uncultured bacterium]
MTDIQASRTIEKADMIAGQVFRFGRAYHNTSRIVEWNPDASVGKNPHVLITGNSGSGKTTLLREVIRYLDHKAKILFVVDLHGDLGVPGVKENYIEITARNPKYGINPFEFYQCPKNGGVGVQRENIVQILKKSFITSMGPMQEKVLKQLITDTYAKVGILDNDVATWDNPLPTIKDMKELMDTIFETINTGFQFEFVKRFQHAGKQIEKLKKKIFFYQKDLDKTEEGNEEKPTDKVREKIGSLEDEIAELVKELDAKWAAYKQYRLFGQAGEGEGDESPIDLQFYSQKDALRALETLSVYITALYETKVFHASVPPVAAGVNRFDISGLEHNVQVFFTDVLLQKVFRAKKLKGEYIKYPSRPRGAKTDTYVVIDESKLILPTGKDKECPFQAMNRIAAESRKYGLGLVLASQKPNHYPHELLTNIDLKVVLTTAPNDVPQAKKLLGIQDENLFKHAERFGVAMISAAAKNFESVCLPWVDVQGWQKTVTLPAAANEIKAAI